MKIIKFNVMEVIARTVAFYFLVTSFSLVATMIYYGEYPLLFYAFFTLVLYMCVQYIISRRVKATTVEQLKVLYPEAEFFNKNLELLYFLYLLSAIVLAVIVYELLYALPAEFANNEHLISTTFEMPQKAYMLIRSVPYSLYCRMAYTAINIDPEFSLGAYQKYFMWDYAFLGVNLVFHVFSVAVNRVRLYNICKRRFEDANY